MRIIHPSSVTHVFFRAQDVIEAAAPGARTAVEAAYAWAVANGYQNSDGPTAATPALPERASNPAALVVIARVGRRLDGGSQELLIYHQHDVIGVSSIDARRSRGWSWPPFEEGWRSAAGQAPVLGAARILACEVHGWLDRARRDQKLSWRPTPGLLVRETPTNSWRTRELLAVAHEVAVLDEWLWTSPTAGLPSLTRYLLHAARLRDLDDYVREQRADYSDAVGRIDDSCAALQRELSGKDVDQSRIRAADRALVSLSTEQHGVISYLTEVRSNLGTATAMIHNLELASNGRLPPTDRQLAGVTLAQLRTDEAYLAAAQLKASEQSRLASSTVTARLDDRKSKLTLLQTTIIGAVGTALAAVQSLDFKVPLRESRQAPVIALLTAVAFTLPSAVLFYFDGTDRTNGWAVVNTIAGGLTGLALGWLLVTLPLPINHAALLIVPTVVGVAAAVARWLWLRRASG